MMWCQAPGRRLLRSAAALAVVLAIGACDFPTESPIFQSRYVIPSDNTTLSVSQLLPSSIASANGGFVLALSPTTVNKTLGTLCPACVPFNGQSVPYPGFTTSFTTTIAIPSDVASAVLTSGAVALNVQNNFGFDPLNPPGGPATGTMTVTVANAGRTIGSTVISGPFPTGTTKSVSVPLTAGTITSPTIDITVAITSPAGGVLPANFVTVNTNGTLNLTATPQAITISSANVAVAAKTISATAIDLNLSDIDESISNHAVSGAIILTITNPFTAGGSLALKITGSGVTINKSIQLTAATSATTPSVTTQRVEFTGAELRQMLGKHLTLTISGPVSATGATVTVTPSQVLSVATSLDLVIQVGGTVTQ